MKLLLVYLSVTYLMTTCHRDIPDFTYKFQEKVELFPFKKSYSIGDTIWIQYSNVSKKMFEKKSSQSISVDTVSVTFSIGYNAKYNYPVINPSGGFADFISSNGINTARYLGEYGNSFTQTFGCNNTNDYSFRVALVPKFKGIYSLNLNGIPRDVSPCLSRVSTFPFSSIEYTFNLADCNKDVFLSIPVDFRGEIKGAKGTTEAEIDKKKLFYFEVK